jgi:hypothetical protein
MVISGIAGLARAGRTLKSSGSSAIAASIAIAAAGVWLASGTAPDGWQVDRSGSGTSRLAVGETLETVRDQWLGGLRAQCPRVLHSGRRPLPDAPGRRQALAILLKEAKKDDAFTLRHLLTRCERGQAPRVYDALAALAPPPAGVSREGILRADPQMLDRWWDELGLGDTSWWRLFEGKWPASSR